VIKAISEHLSGIHRYPDNTCHDIAETMGALRGVDPARIIFGNGSESIMSNLANFCLKPGDKVVSLLPSFPLINILCSTIGAELIGVPHENDLTFSVDRFCEAVSGDVRLVYLCMPNNPTGSYFTASELEKIVAAAHPEALFVIDEAYLEFAGNKADYPDARAIMDAAEQPYISLHTMSKAYGLAGMRVGYGIAYCSDFTAMLKRASTVFNVGVLSLRAAKAAMDDAAHLQKYLDVVYTERARLEEVLKSRQVRYFTSAGNFICLSIQTFARAQEIEVELQKVGIFVKSQKGRGGEGLVRITIGTPVDNDRMLDSLVALL
jgi:histidinol-phosphate aminotransferase